MKLAVVGQPVRVLNFAKSKHRPRYEKKVVEGLVVWFHLGPE